MAETSKNKIYYNDNENSVADVLADMKKMAESTDKAIENSKYNDAQIKKDISDAKKEQALKDAEQDNKIIELQNEKTELEKELKEAQEDFYQNSIRGQASGEYIHVEDSNNCRAKIGIGGNHEQETRSGKNYLNTLAKYKAGEKVTVDGITYIFNEDGSITCNGTADTDSIFNFSTLNLQKIDGTSKKLVASINGEYTYTKAVTFIAYDKNFGNTKYVNLTGSNKNYEQVLTDNVEYAIFRIVIYKDTIIKNRTLYLQILDKSISDLTYEQYGASPSPDYTSPVVAVGSNVNEFDIDTVKDGFLNEKTGEIISNNSWKCSDFIEILNKTYTFGWESSSDYFQVTVCYYDENKKFISGKSYGLRGTFNNTFEVVSNAKYMKIAYSVSVSGEVATREKIKLEKGKVATPYSKYGQGCVKVTKRNKNIMDLAKCQIKTSNGVTSTYNKENNSITFNGTCTGNNTLFNIYIDNINAKKNATTLTAKWISGTVSGYAVARCYDEDWKQNVQVNLAQLNASNKISGKTYNDVADVFSHFDFRFDNGTVLNNFTIQLMLTDVVDNDYIEHQGQSYIMPLQQEMLVNDYLDYDNEEEVHIWGKKILTGDEGWRMPSSNDTNAVFTNLSNTDFCDFKSDTDVQYCNYFKYKGIAQGFAVALNKGVGIYSFYSVNKYEYFVAPKAIASSVNEWKVWLKSQYDAGTPVVVYYQLATPTRLKFTDEQKAVAKELNNARTYKNVTNITTDSKAILSLDYVKDQETQNQKMQNEIDEIKQLLSTTQTSAMLLDNLQKEVESEVE